MDHSFLQEEIQFMSLRRVQCQLCGELNTGNGHTAHHPMPVRGRNWPPEDQEPPETPYPIERLSEAQRLLVDGGGK